MSSVVDFGLKVGFFLQRLVSCTLCMSSVLGHPHLHDIVGEVENSMFDFNQCLSSITILRWANAYAHATFWRRIKFLDATLYAA